jgi:hypothetical protein
LKLLQGMLEVMQNFRDFQCSLVAHLEQADALGLEMDWSGDADEESEDSDGPDVESFLHLVVDEAFEWHR